MKHILQSHSNFNRTVCITHLEHISKNYDTILSFDSKKLLCPMIKANAYGHGDIQVARTLSMKKNLYGFGVATLDEGKKIRSSIKKKIPILIFAAGASPWTKETENFCLKHQLTPVLSSEIDLIQFFNLKSYKKISYEIKFNTGMNRLGVNFEYAHTIKNLISKLKKEFHPKGILSHLACSDDVTHPLNKIQIKIYIDILKMLQPICDSTHFHISNSGAIWNQDKLGLKSITSVIRPGLALYGIPPFPKASKKGLKPGLSLFSKVLTRRTLWPGQSIGYGARFSILKKTEVAILATGYADALHRKSSLGKNPGLVYMNKKTFPIIGTLSMDLTATQCSPKTLEGDWVEIYGKNICAWQQAKSAGTLPYELLTSIHSRVKRIYE